MRTLFLAWACLLLTIPCSADIIYVKEGGTGSGSSWADAYGDLQDGLNDAVSGDEIWVASGTYYPTYGYGLWIGSRGKHFRMKNGVAIYGGFDGTETSLAERNVQNNETILSGDIGVPDDPDDNCYHVFYHPSGTNLDATAILDGFTVTAGNAGDSSEPHNDGGGMYNDYSSPTVTGCSFVDNSADLGGGMFNNYSDPTVTGCTFTGNLAGNGGGMYNDTSSPEVINCIFSSNSAGDGHDGGGIGNYRSSTIVTNCTFLTNEASRAGGALNSDHDSNCTV